MKFYKYIFILAVIFSLTSCFLQNDLYKIAMTASEVETGDAAPYIQSVSSYSNTEVLVYYSEDVDLASSENNTNYSIPGLSVVSATRDAANYTKVILVTGSQGDGTNYTLTINSVKDLNGNIIGSPNSMGFIGTGVIDTTVPTILSAVLVDGDTVEVRFSEPVDQVLSETVGNYTIEDNDSNLVSATAASRQADTSMVWVDISGIFSKGLYNITVSTNVEDLNNNQLEGPPNNTVSFAGQATYISNTVATSNIDVRVYFSDEVEQASAETAGNYSIPGLTVTGATRDLVDFSIVDLTTSPQEDINYTLTVTVVIDQDSRQFGGDVEPYIQSVCSYSNTEVFVYFSEAVEIASAESLTNYSIPGLTIISATRDAADFSKINLDTGSQGDGTNYTLTINSVTDLNGNSILNPGTMDFTGTGVTDNTSPRVLSAVLVDSNTVEVRFSEPVDQVSSETVGNYKITDNVGNSVSVTSASRQADISKVRLDTSGTFSECLYSLEVSASVEDTGFNPMAGPPDNTVSFAGQGTLPQSFNDGPVLVDPIGEGANNFSMLTKYRGRIYLGPANADNAVFRFKPDGSDPEIVSFSFHVGATYTTSLNPGPDTEDGIDYITGGIINGNEYLFIGPSSSNSIDYIYFTTESGNTLDFDPIDLSAVLGPNTRGISSMIVFNNNLYIGLPDQGGNRPYLSRIVNIVENPVTGVDVFNLEGDDMPRLGQNGTPSNGEGKVCIDTFGIFNDRIYLANGGKNAVDEDGGIVKSTTNSPLDYSSYPGDWADITPASALEWNNFPLNDRFSIALSNISKLIPADKAFPAMAEFNNKLYVIRNTVGSPGGPQLWKYDEFVWSLVADNGLGLTDMGNIKNSSITLLVVNGDRLYIGYDNDTSGIQIWRTAAGVTDPAIEADFEPVSTDGFGDPANNQRIYHGLSISDGGTDYLWLLSGKSGGSIRVYRTIN